MTNYISRSGGQKKKNILHQREMELRGELRREGPENRIHRKAEKVRLAQVGVIKALLAESKPLREEDKERSDVIHDKLLKVKAYWEGISVQDIILLYTETIDESSQINRKKWWDFRRMYD